MANKNPPDKQAPIEVLLDGDCDRDAPVRSMINSGVRDLTKHLRGVELQSFREDLKPVLRKYHEKIKGAQTSMPGKAK